MKTFIQKQDGWWYVYQHRGWAKFPTWEEAIGYALKYPFPNFQ